jgi:hypothetical protein
VNELIQKLAEQAGFLNKDEESIGYFAELIVRECANQVDWILAEGGKTQGDLIKEHFGVEE